ncbi:MAG: S1/P1 nuclease [Proteobacteria bacterium]|nr:S1/P1 nuclease [Pseudomonadota bacterium]
MRAAALSFLFLIGAAAPARAWGPDGHRIACSTAWDEMAAPVRAKVTALLELSQKEAFAESCAWLDTQAQTNLHHVFVPKAARAIVMARDCANGCALTEIGRSVAILKSNATQADQARALKTLAHLVADIHQPLNIGFAEDGGGAQVKGSFRGKAVTLRAMWEQEMIATLIKPNSSGLSYDFKSIEGRAPETRARTPLDWANETLWIMRSPATGYLGTPGGIDYDDTYVGQNRRVALAQLDKAGVRLAALLTDILDGT